MKYIIAHFQIARDILMTDQVDTIVTVKSSR